MTPRRPTPHAPDPLPEHLRPLPPARGGRAWLWQVPVAVTLTLGVLYAVAGLVDHCATDQRFCPRDVPQQDGLQENGRDTTPPGAAARATRDARPAGAAERPVMTLAHTPLPLSMSTGPTPRAYHLPPGTTVQDAATSASPIALDRVNLIAVVESDGQRHALVRLANGRILRLQEGDRLQGSTVAAIGPDTLYVLRANNTPHALVLGGADVAGLDAPAAPRRGCPQLSPPATVKPSIRQPCIPQR